MALNRRVAIYAGTFDPLTRGHEDIVRRAAGLFDQLIVAIAASQAKRPFFSLEERSDMAREVLAPYPNVEVCSFEGLLMDFLHSRGAKVILRGLRAASDFEYEFQMAGMNQQLNDDIETVFLMADVALQPIASRLVKEIASYGGAIDTFVPPRIAAEVRDRIAATKG